MSARKTFLSAIEALTPWWMRAGEGQAVLESMAILKDLMAERIQQSLMLRFPSHAAEDALPKIGEDRVMPQIFGESVEGYRARLLGWRGRWGHRYRGNPLALLRLVILVLGDSARQQGVLTVDRRGNRYQMLPNGEPDEISREAVTWDWDGTPASPQWGRGWLVLYVDAQPWSSWTEMLTTIWAGGDGSTASIGMKNWSTSRAKAIRGLVSGNHPWKMAGTRAEYAIYVPEGINTFPAPDRTWGRWAGSTRGTSYVFGRLKPDALG